MHDTLVILDFGSQYTQLIARAVRAQGVYSLILPCSTPLSAIRALSPKGIVLSGGPASVTGAKSPRCDEGIFTLGVPVLGICYGMQLLAHERGGRVESGDVREYGRARIRVEPGSRLFEGLAATEDVWMSHGDKVVALPPGFQSIAVSEGTGSAGERYGHCVAMESMTEPVYAVQFHPEVHHTPHGARILGNFALGICGCRADWTPATFVEESIAAIRAQVGDGKVILGYSGGVDSTIAAVLLHRAIGDRLIPVFVDNGLLRLNEREDVRTRFEAEFGIRLHVHDYSAEFLAALDGVTEPETKRKIIGRHFIDAFSAALRKEKAAAGDVEFLAQGTLYPDVIESTSASGGPSATIKTHHNVGGLPDDLQFKLVEPLRWLFKDDVRRVGRQLGVPEDLVGRHPFPGPGLAVRCLGPLTPARLQTLREADAIFIEELRAAGQYDHVAQALAVLLPVKSVGVMGDARTYEEVVALRAVTTQDFMTADWADLPRDLLARVSNRIINEVKGVNRVVYDISSKPPATIEWE